MKNIYFSREKTDINSLSNDDHVRGYDLRLVEINQQNILLTSIIKPIKQICKIGSENNQKINEMFIKKLYKRVDKNLPEARRTISNHIFPQIIMKRQQVQVKQKLCIITIAKQSKGSSIKSVTSNHKIKINDIPIFKNQVTQKNILSNNDYQQIKPNSSKLSAFKPHEKHVDQILEKKRMIMKLKRYNLDQNFQDEAFRNETIQSKCDKSYLSIKNISNQDSVSIFKKRQHLKRKHLDKILIKAKTLSVKQMVLSP